MIVVAILPALVALAGLLTYVLAANQKLAECGRVAFACGLLVCVYVLAGHVVRLG